MNARIWLRNVLAGVITVLTLSGCGDGSETTPSGPLEGREISRASQLEGTWLGTTEGDFIGFEFMDDGKVLATPFTAALTGLSGGAMYSYSILEGGRLSLVAPNGQTQIYGVTIAGVVIAFVLSAALGLIAAIIPARTVARLKVVDSLRTTG